MTSEKQCNEPEEKEEHIVKSEEILSPLLTAFLTQKEMEELRTMPFTGQKKQKS